MDVTANSLPEASFVDMGAGKFQLLFSSAENELEEEFLLRFLKKDSKFQSLSGRNRRRRIAYGGNLDWKEVYYQTILINFSLL